MELMDIQHRILLIELMDIQHCWVTSCMLAMAGRLAAGKGRDAYIPIKMASGVQDKPVFL